MIYLLDTDWLIGYLVGRHAAVDLVAILTREDIALSVITLGEVFEGLVRRPLQSEQEAAMRRFLADVMLLGVDEAMAYEYARLRSHLRSIGNLIPDNDLWIAATALTYGLTLVSRDQHFAKVPGLQRYEAGA